MIELEPHCYLVGFDKKDEYVIGSKLDERIIISIELYYLEGEKYLRIKTLPINFVI